MIYRNHQSLLITKGILIQDKAYILCKVSLESQELKVCIFISLKWKKVKAVSRVHEDTQKILKSQ